MLFPDFLRQIDRYLPHQTKKYPAKMHLKTTNDKIKTVSNTGAKLYNSVHLNRTALQTYLSAQSPKSIEFHYTLQYVHKDVLLLLHEQLYLLYGVRNYH